MNFSILEKVENSKLTEREQHWLDTTKSFDPNIGYNVLNKAYSNAGFTHSKATKTKISETLSGIKRSDSTRNKLALRDLSYLSEPSIVAKRELTKRGRKTSEMTKAKQSTSLKQAYANGTKVPWLKGKPMSEEMKLKISQANKGRKLTEEHKQKLLKPKSTK